MYFVVYAQGRRRGDFPANRCVVLKTITSRVGYFTTGFPSSVWTIASEIKRADADDASGRVLFGRFGCVVTILSTYKFYTSTTIVYLVSY